MSLPVPKLDDLQFERLFEDARALIPRYAPDWTDHNFHDPGITLIDLVAWIADQEIYRIGFVGDSHLRAFAALLGVEPQRARPARGLIWPTAAVNSARQLWQSQRVANIEQPDTDFVLERAVYLTSAKLTGMAAVLGGDRRSLDRLGVRPGVSYTPALQLDGAEHLELRFDAPLVREAGEPRIVALGIRIEPRPSMTGDDAKLWGPLAFDYAAEGEDWQRLEIEDDGTRALARSGVVLLRVPPAAVGPSSLRMRFDRGFLPIAPKLTNLAVNVLPVVQLKRNEGAVLGRSNGLPDQSFRVDLAGRPAQGQAVAPFVLEVGEATRRTRWAETADLGQSCPGDRHYVIDERAGEIRFGNGINGRIPPRDTQILHEAFHTTLGRAGNLSAGLTWRITDGGGTVFLGRNLEAMAGGTDASSIRELIAAARMRAVDRHALLTNAELKSAAEELAGFAVARAEVAVRHDPAFPGAPIRGARTLVVVPARDPMTPPTPVPHAYIQAVNEALAPRRLLGERLSIRVPRHVRIDVHLHILVAAGADPVTACGAVEERVRARLSDLPRHGEIRPWPLGRVVTASEISELAVGVEEVVAVLACGIARAGATRRHARIRLDPDEVAIAADVSVEATVEAFGRA